MKLNHSTINNKDNNNYRNNTLFTKSEKSFLSKLIPDNYLDNYENKFNSLINENKNPSQKYYLCKTCSNKILCQNCFEAHDKKDEVFKLKIDSTCKKHYSQYETYCPICKENKCSYCSIDNEENHEKEEFLLKKKLFKKNKLDGFKNNIKRINNLKCDIEQKLNSLVKELENQIKYLNNIKNKFFESLNMEIKFVELILDNYEKKLKDFDINYYLINNLENQINFNLTELDYKEDYSLDKKIENITSYLNKNLNSQFKLDSGKNNQIQFIENNETKNDIIEVNYEKKKYLIMILLVSLILMNIFLQYILLIS
jgi:hypothetical protein